MGSVTSEPRTEPPSPLYVRVNLPLVLSTVTTAVVTFGLFTSSGTSTVNGMSSGAAPQSWLPALAAVEAFGSSKAPRPRVPTINMSSVLS